MSELSPTSGAPGHHEAPRGYISIADHRMAMAGIGAEREAWRYRAMHDELTLLLRFPYWKELVDARLQRGESLAVVAFDIDNFKRVNDTRGHRVGDELLVQWANYLEPRYRRGDDELAARRSGDEFLAAVSLDAPATEQAPRAQTLAARLDNVQTHAMKVVGGFVGELDEDIRELGVNVSLGIAASQPGRRLTVEALVNEADLAMYAAKRRAHGLE